MSLKTGELDISGPLYTLNSTLPAISVKLPSSSQNSSSGNGELILATSGDTAISTAVASDGVLSTGVLVLVEGWEMRTSADPGVSAVADILYNQHLALGSHLSLKEAEVEAHVRV